MANLVEYRKSKERFATPTGSCDGEWNSSLSQMNRLDLGPIEGPSSTFVQGLHYTARRSVPPLIPAMVLDVFFATMILAIVKLFWYEESSAGMNEPEATWPTRLLCQPVLLALKTSKHTWDELCYFNDVSIPLRDDERHDRMCSGSMYSSHHAVSLLPICLSSLPGEALSKFIDRVEVEWSLDVDRDGAQKDPWVSNMLQLDSQGALWIRHKLLLRSASAWSATALCAQEDSRQRDAEDKNWDVRC